MDKSRLASPASTGRQQSWQPSIAPVVVEATGAWGAASSGWPGPTPDTNPE